MKLAGTHMDALCLHMYVLKQMEKKHYDNKDIYYAVTGAVKKYEEILADSFRTVRKENPGGERSSPSPPHIMNTMLSSFSFIAR